MTITRATFEASRINWPSFGMFLTVKRVLRETTWMQIAEDAGVGLRTAQKAGGGQVVNAGTYLRLCRWMNEKPDTFLLDEKGLAA